MKVGAAATVAVAAIVAAASKAVSHLGHNLKTLKGGLDEYTND